MLILNLLVVTPTTTKALLDAGYDVSVEKSSQSIFDGVSILPKD